MVVLSRKPPPPPPLLASAEKAVLATGKGDNYAWVAGAVIGGVAAIAVLALLGFYMKGKKRRRFHVSCIHSTPRALGSRCVIWSSFWSCPFQYLSLNELVL